ncbi:MAG: FecR family protein [Treponema sp.]|nr:FecR family protein [Treponema sp.]
MKKIFMTLLIAGLSAPVFAQTAVLREVSGTVEVKRSAGAGWTRAAAGMRLERNMVISTGFKSTAFISLGNSSIAVRPLTRMSIEDLAASQGSETAAFFLQAGRIRAKVNPPVEGGKVNFQVRSPTATASVRGTEFDMDSSNVKMYSGAVAFAGGDGVPAIVGAGQSGYAGAGGQVSSGLSPDLPLGIRPKSGGKAVVPASLEGSITGRIGWYGQKPR